LFILTLTQNKFHFPKSIKMSKELTKEQRGAIFYCRQRGDSYRTIAATVGCGPSTVFDTLKRMNETGTTNSRPRSSRPPLIEPSQRNWLKRLVTNGKEKNRRLCTAEVQQLWKKKTNQDVSANIIVRTHHKSGLRNCLARRKPLISPANMEARLAWALEHQSWTKHNWAKVMWSDESTFSQFQQNRCSRVWREPQDEWNLSCVAATVKHSPGRMF
jgi:transposase